MTKCSISENERDIRVEADSLVVLFKCRSPAVSADFNSAIPWHDRCESSDQQASHVTIFLLLLLMTKRSVMTESRGTVSGFRAEVTRSGSR